MSVPDYVEPFLGWKGLLADAEGGLWSPAMPVLWPDDGPLVAQCEIHAAHEPPVTSCGCGVYALKTYEALKEHRYHYGLVAEANKTWVIARIALYGRVRNGKIGWRASKAEPVAVYVSAMNLPLGRKIRDRYGIPLKIINRFTGERSS